MCSDYKFDAIFLLRLIVTQRRLFTVFILSEEKYGRGNSNINYLGGIIKQLVYKPRQQKINLHFLLSFESLYSRYQLNKDILDHYELVFSQGITRSYCLDIEK